MVGILITGTNRGLGLGLIKALNKLPSKPKYIIGTCRNIEAAVELRQLAEENKNIHILQYELLETNKYPQLVDDVKNIVGDRGLNVLFNNAGIAPRSTKINGTKEDELIETFMVNTIVPIMLSKAFIPLLKQASENNSATPMGVNRAAIVNMSSILASITLNKEGGVYNYRISKTAINAITKSLSLDLNHLKILCVAIHPGWVRTDLGGPKAPLDVETSCTKMLDSLAKLTEKDNGSFLQYDGKKLPY